MVGEPAVGDGSKTGAGDARQGVKEETVDGDNQEKSSAEDESSKGEVCDQAGSVRCPAEDEYDLGWHPQWH